MLGKTAQGGNLEGKGRSRILFAKRKEAKLGMLAVLPLQGMLPQDECNSYGMKFWGIRDQTGKFGCLCTALLGASLILKWD